MSQSTPVLKRTIRATAAITRGRFVGFDGAHTAAAGQAWFGVAEYPAAIGQDVSCVVMGTAIVEAAAAFAVGDAVMPSNNGRAQAASNATIAAGAVAVTSAAANGAGTLAGSNLPQTRGGFCMQASAAAGQFIEVMLAR